VAQITTGTACHLDAEMVARGLEAVDMEGVKVLFIENVGNLVCPAEFDLGEALRVVLLSTTEGEDKPLKYPPIFKSAHVVILTKTDVAGVLGFDCAAARNNIRRVAPQARLIELSSRSGEGMDAWYALLSERLPGLR
jgi:hydrogenase nickel incorporation protein HypB